MAIEPPARFAVIGAGPVGLEAALYARFLGFDVVIYEQGEVAEHVGRRGHAALRTPFRENSTSLGRAALRAHDEAFSFPPPGALLTGADWAERYLLPLSQTDLLVDCLRLKTRVTDVSRLTYRKTDVEGIDIVGEDEERRDEPLRVMAVWPNGEETVDYFDAVIDASGVLSQPCGIGPGGAPAIGERALADRIERGVVAPERIAATPPGTTVLLVGDDSDADENVALFAEVAARDATFRCLWVNARPERQTIAEAPWLERYPFIVVEEIDSADDGSFRVRFAARAALPGSLADGRSVHRVVANVGYRPDLSPSRELQVRRSSDAESVIARDAALTGVEALLHPEADFYVLGAKTFGRRHDDFALMTGFRQIRDVFAYVGERDDLDLYRRYARDEGAEWAVGQDRTVEGP